MGEARKLRKKLRQIENLEVKHSLTPEETFKISRKAELRSRLAALQQDPPGPPPPPGTEGTGKQEKMKRQVEAPPAQEPPASKLPRGEERAGAEAPPASPAGRGETGGGAETGVGEESHRQDQGGSDLESMRASWAKAKFRLRKLVGHHDIITCVVAVDNMVVSGSRDTTVKVWHVPTATEQKNLGGHTGAVTCLSAPSHEYCRRLARDLYLSTHERFILSGSVDCNVKIWALNAGQCVKSIYTFNAITSLCFVPEDDGYIVTGSDGGKVQVWSFSTFQNLQSVNAHQDAVTSLQSQGPLVFSGSAEGGVSVWENRGSGRDPLRLLQRWSVGATGGGGRVALSPRGERVLLADGHAWIRILDWRTGAVSRLTNHSSVAGVTDCVHQAPGLLVTSCYDLAGGDGCLNLFSLPGCGYLASLTWTGAPRMLCVATWTTGSGDHRWVTGGRDLVVWEQLPASGRQRSDVTVRRDAGMDSQLESEEEEEEEEETDGLDEEEEEEEEEEDGAAGGRDGGSWLRCLVQ